MRKTGGSRFTERSLTRTVTVGCFQAKAGGTARISPPASKSRGRSLLVTSEQALAQKDRVKRNPRVTRPLFEPEIGRNVRDLPVQIIFPIDHQ